MLSVVVLLVTRVAWVAASFVHRVICKDTHVASGFGGYTCPQQVFREHLFSFLLDKCLGVRFWAV